MAGELGEVVEPKVAPFLLDVPRVPRGALRSVVDARRRSLKYVLKNLTVAGQVAVLADADIPEDADQMLICIEGGVVRLLDEGSTPDAVTGVPYAGYSYLDFSAATPDGLPDFRSIKFCLATSTVATIHYSFYRIVTGG